MRLTQMLSRGIAAAAIFAAMTAAADAATYALVTINQQALFFN